MVFLLKAFYFNLHNQPMQLLSVLVRFLSTQTTQTSHLGEKIFNTELLLVDSPVWGTFIDCWLLRWGQPTVGSATPTQVVLNGVRKQAGQAVHGEQASKQCFQVPACGSYLDFLLE